MSGGEPIPGLSPTDSMLVASVRAGMLDAESAVRLGLTVTDVRRRIETVMMRLGFADRAELRSWDPVVRPFPADLAELTAPAPAATARPGELSAPKPRGPILSLVSLAGVAVVVGLGLWWFTNSGSSSIATPAPPTTAVVTTPAPSAVPATFAGVPLRPLTPLPATDLPPGLALYSLIDCDCGRPVQELVRLYRDLDGQVHRDTLFRADDYSGDPLASIFSVWAEGDASDIAVAVCVDGECGAQGPIVPLTARTVVWRSHDGGMSWDEAGPPLTGLVSILGASDGQLLIRQSLQIAPQTAHESYLRYPSGEPLTQPPPGLYPSAPFTYGAGRVAWLSGSEPAVIGATGATVLGITDTAARPFARAVARPRTAESWAISWYPEAKTPDQPEILTGLVETAASGAVRSAVVYLGLPVTPLLWLDAHRVLASVAVSVPLDFPGPPGASSPLPVAAIVDFDAATLTPLVEPLSILGRNRVIAAWRGEFVRIGALAGCVTVLADPDPVHGRHVACLPGRSIVSILGARVVGGEGWLHVRTPAGRIGWLRSTPEVTLTR